MKSLVCTCLLIVGIPAHAVVVPPPEIGEPIVATVTTPQVGEFGGRKLRYRASFSEQLLHDAQGKPLATISATAYTVDAPKKAPRPLLFAFNGGPGASSSPLHFGAFGPLRTLRREDGSRSMVPNNESLLPFADLVFIDPVGTGFSRVLPGGSGSPYWSIEGDATATLEFIRDWIKSHGCASAPIYIAGESYGGFRLATLARSAGDLNLAGLILISPALDFTSTSADPANDLPYIFTLPTMAVAAAHHHRGELRDQPVAQVFESATAFAEGEYASALLQGDALPAGDRERIAGRLSGLLGLPAQTIQAANLRIDSEVFLRSLLKDEGKLVGRLDTRITAPFPVAAPKDRPAAAQDPALGLGATNVIVSKPIGDYLRDTLKVPAQRDYVSLTLDVNFLWNWDLAPRNPGAHLNATPNLAALMQKLPQLRLLVVGGYYDLATPVLGVRHAIRHGGLPAERVSTAVFEAGHSPFEGDAGRARMNALLHEFLQGTAVAAPTPVPVAAPAPATKR